MAEYDSNPCEIARRLTEAEGSGRQSVRPSVPHRRRLSGRS